MVNETLQSIEQKMKASIKVFHADLAAIRTGHATPALIEHIKVEYAGVPTPLNQLAGISAPEPGLLGCPPHKGSYMALHSLCFSSAGECRAISVSGLDWRQ